MSVSTAARLASGLLTFALLARMLGPTDFGVLMFWLSVATLLAILASYGFTPYILREVGTHPESADTVMSEVLTAKLLTGGALMGVAMIGVAFVEPGLRWVFLALLLMTLSESAIEFLNVRYRVANRFATETKMASAAAIGQFAIVSSIVWFSTSITAAASAMLLSRVVVLAVTWQSQKGMFARLLAAPIKRGLYRLKTGASYAFDYSLQSLIGQIDSIVLNHFIGPAAVGIHQAGMRLFLGGGQMANILGNVYIPRLAAVVALPARIQLEAQRLQTAFFLAGALFGLTLAVGAKPIVLILFGSQFLPLAALLPWFGLLFFVRFVAAAYGVLLTSAGKQSLRAKANLAHWSLILVVAWAIVPSWGNLGWLLALISGNLLLALTYFLATRQLVKVTGVNAGIAVLGLSAMLPFLHLT